MARRQPEQQAPPVQKVRVRYRKSGPARFTSTRDVGRILERALRRAEIPMAYSSGFSPHPRISYANSAPTGAATEAEYLELGLSQRCDLGKLHHALDQAMPPGFDIVAVAESDSRSWPELLSASRWLIRIDHVSFQELSSATQNLVDTDTVEVSRMTKSGKRVFDIKPAIEAVAAMEEPYVGLELVSHHTTPLVRPDDVVSGLRQVNPDLELTHPPLLHRLEQGVLVDGKIQSPFEV